VTVILNREIAIDECMTATEELLYCYDYYDCIIMLLVVIEYISL
jgi:hypothetical protein